MVRHGEAPKCVFVAAYERMQGNCRRSVRKHMRRWRYKLCVRPTWRQLDFGF